MPDRPAGSPGKPAKGERATRPSPDAAGDGDPKGSPTADRHTSETAGGQHKHHQPQTTDRPDKPEGKTD